MIKKILNRFFVICTFAGFLIILGAAGSSDLGQIEIRAIVVQSLIGIGVTFLGFIGLRLIGSEYIA